MSGSGANGLKNKEALRRMINEDIPKQLLLNVAVHKSHK